MVYTEEELKMWFDLQMKKYPNCAATWHYQYVRDMMFSEDIWENDNLKNTVDKLRKGEYNKDVKGRC